MQNLRPENVKDFPAIRTSLLLDKLREDVVMFLVSRPNEDSYFNMGQFSKPNNIGSIELSKFVELISSELKELGWKCSTSFGGTGLFIYSGERPKSCWDGSF